MKLGKQDRIFKHVDRARFSLSEVADLLADEPDFDPLPWHEMAVRATTEMTVLIDRIHEVKRGVEVKRRLADFEAAEPNPLDSDQHVAAVVVQKALQRARALGVSEAVIAVIVAGGKR